MSIRCYTGARLYELAPAFESPPLPPVKRLESALRGRQLSARRCTTCAGWTNNRACVCTRCLLAGRGRK